MLIKRLFNGLRSSIFIQRTMSSAESSDPSEYSTCFTTLGKMDDARQLARSIVENHLAACVNMIPSIRSIYEWKSTIQEDEEILLMIKTRKDKVQQLLEFVKKNHPYELPEFIQLPIQNGNPDYLKWIDQIVKQQQ